MRRSWSRVASAASVLSAALLGACSVAPPAPPDAAEAAGPTLRPLPLQIAHSAGAPPRSQVASVRYELLGGDDDGVPGDPGSREAFQRGGASWYGLEFHNRKTANGERFDMGAMTAAHRTLPFGSRVCVRSLVNGKEVLVRINDRGPYAAGRIIDLSRAAAGALDMIGIGIKQVALTLVDREAARCGGLPVGETEAAPLPERRAPPAPRRRR